MAQIRIERVLALPVVEELIASTMYIVQGAGANDAEIYFTNNDGTSVRHLPTHAEVDQRIAAAIGDFQNIQVLSNLEARDALTLDRVTLALVLDATGDPSVENGSALYVYDLANTTWNKVAEYESLDLSLTWEALGGIPEVLKGLEDVDGQLTYKGEPVGNVLAKAEW